ncbi:MAG TPA: HEPN domain-containing protein, partial [Bryobacteraceae bacterium]|jgi:HEPN domain-containing protein|nr:HEPN domain-containing protein [Bryobacteraceae bacterium]
MLQDPTHVIATQAWFIKANEDLREAEFVLTASPPFVGSSLFHSEQAVEKALKGYLTWRQVAFTTDDLEQLRTLCGQLDPALGEVLLPVDALTEYAFRFRYPNDLAEPGFDQATDTLRLAAAVVRAVLAKVVADAQR